MLTIISQTLAYGPAGVDITKPFQKRDWEQQLLSGIIAINASFRSVENPEFVKTYTNLKPGLQVPKRTKIRNLLKVRMDEVIASIINDMRDIPKISIALDCWTSPNNLAFMAITAYYITSDWQYKEVLIGFEHVKGSHTGARLAEVINTVLTTVDIKHKLYAITTDNASNNDTMRGKLSEVLRREHMVEWDPADTKIACLAHVVQLVVKQLLGVLKAEAVNNEPETTWDINTFKDKSNKDDNANLCQQALVKVSCLLSALTIYANDRSSEQLH